MHKVALKEFLKYILPFGYIYILRVYKEPETDLLTKITYSNNVNVYKSSIYNLGTLRTATDNTISPDIDYDNSNDDAENDIESEVSHLLSTYDLGLIVSDENEFNKYITPNDSDPNTNNTSNITKI